jgi:hypothetical protein
MYGVEPMITLSGAKKNDLDNFSGFEPIETNNYQKNPGNG